VHPDGYDAWRHRDLFIRGVSLGAPPDLLAIDGQNWSFEPLDPERLRETGYDYLIRYLRHHLSVAAMLRVDHAIGLYRSFWIPQGAAGREGVFMRQRADELYAILSLESHRHGAMIVGENLGLVPPEVDRGLREHGMAGMYVQSFSFTGDAERPVRPPPADAVVCFGTHDTAPFAAYWTDEDLRERERIGVNDAETMEAEAEARRPHKQALLRYLQKQGLVSEQPSTDEMYRGATALLAQSEAAWLQLNLEDTWGETRSQNVPGTLSEQHPNWSFRAAYGLDELDGVRGLTETIDLVRRLRPTTAIEQPQLMQEGGAGP
jgi:4-alpha-glucanotransferase